MIEVLLFETFPDASLFARQLAKRSAKVVRLWPDARGWRVENLVSERSSHGVEFCEQEDSKGSAACVAGGAATACMLHQVQGFLRSARVLLPSSGSTSPSACTHSMPEAVQTITAPSGAAPPATTACARVGASAPNATASMASKAMQRRRSWEANVAAV